MKQRPLRSSAVSLCVLACVAAAAVSMRLPARDVRAADWNGDGRPDIWRVYDRQGKLAKVAVDTNFDGRSDVQDYYEGGALVRRESDRDFNDRVDLVQEFDPTTREAVRSVVDIDFDGMADLLILFQRGQPVFAKRAHLATPVIANGNAVLIAGASRRTADDALAPLEDPFRTDFTVKAVHVAAGSSDSVGLSTSGGLPTSSADVVGPLASSSRLVGLRLSHTSSAPVVPYSPRGPPASHLLS